MGYVDWVGMVSLSFAGLPCMQCAPYLRAFWLAHAEPLFPDHYLAYSTTFLQCTAHHAYKPTLHVHWLSQNYGQPVVSAGACCMSAVAAGTCCCLLQARQAVQTVRHQTHKKKNCWATERLHHTPYKEHKHSTSRSSNHNSSGNHCRPPIAAKGLEAAQQSRSGLCQTARTSIGGLPLLLPLLLWVPSGTAACSLLAMPAVVEGQGQKLAGLAGSDPAGKLQLPGPCQVGFLACSKAEVIHYNAVWCVRLKQE